MPGPITRKPVEAPNVSRPAEPEVKPNGAQGASSTQATASGGPVNLTDVQEFQTALLSRIGPGTNVAEIFNHPAIQALGPRISRELDIAAAQYIVQNARARIAQMDPAQIDAEHAQIKSQSIPRTPEEMVSVLLDRLRIGGGEREIVMRAVKHVLSGAAAPGENMMSIGGPSPNNHSTQMAVTDEGYDHILMSLADPRMTNKAWLHIERINRVDETGQGTPHAQPYALPPETLVGLIRLLVGNDAPTTVFYGRPNFIPSVVSDKIPKPHNDAVSAGLFNNSETAVRGLQMLARYAFERGVSEVKVSMDGMNEKEAVKFMKDVADPLNLPKGVNFLSAAFNLPRALVDLGVGKPLKGPPTAEDRKKLLEVGLEAIDITSKGGWGKVTLDSASMTPPSYPLIEFFGVENLVEWVHQAHMKGLETYVSGGMQPYHFPLLAMTGVDGVGVGTSIHESTPFAGIMGRMVPSRVHDALERRDKTESSWPGQVIYLLRRLDERVAENEPLSDTEKLLQSKAHQLLTGWAREVDAGLDGLKASRDEQLRSLADQKKNGTISDDEHARATKAAQDGFRQAFERLVNEKLADPKFVAECKKLAEYGAQNGYSLRGTPEANA